MRSLSLFLKTGLIGLSALSCFVVPELAVAKPYKGGEVFSQQLYKYGRMEMRMRMARGSGILSTFFTYKDGSEGSSTFWEEIDIEVFGKDDAMSWQSNIITGLGDRTTSEEEHHYSLSLADHYHTYVLEWTPDYVAWEIDGIEVRRTMSAQVDDLTNPQSLRFNLWAANIASWVGDFDDSALPQYQYINWISYSSYENGQFVHQWTDDFNSFDGGRWGTANWTFAENLVDFDPNNVAVKDGTLVLALTREGQTGTNVQVPADDGVVRAGEIGMMGTGGSAPGSGGASGGSDNQGPSAGGSTAVSSGGALGDPGNPGDPGDSGDPGTVPGTSSGGSAAGNFGSGGGMSTGSNVDGMGMPPSAQSGCAYVPGEPASGRFSAWLLLVLAAALGVGRASKRSDRA